MAVICDMAMGRLADRRYFIESVHDRISRYCDLFITETKELFFFSVCLVPDHISPRLFCLVDDMRVDKN